MYLKVRFKPIAQTNLIKAIVLTTPFLVSGCREIDIIFVKIVKKISIYHVWQKSVILEDQWLWQLTVDSNARGQGLIAL